MNETTIDEQVLNKKLAEWAGFYCLEGIWTIYGEDVLEPTLPNFAQSLDACFRWLVPKLIYCSLTKMEKAYRDNYWICEVRLEQEGKRYYGDALEKSPELCLCLAIEKLIDSKEKIK